LKKGFWTPKNFQIERAATARPCSALTCSPRPRENNCLYKTKVFCQAFCKKLAAGGTRPLSVNHLDCLIDKELTVEVVELVAESAGKELRACDVDSLAVAVHRTDGDVHRTFDDACSAGDREAALLLGLLAGKGDYLGVDELNNLTGLGLDDHNSLEYSHLRRGKSASVSGAHSLDHIVKKSEHAGSYFINGTADLSECLVTDFYNF